MKDVIDALKKKGFKFHNMKFKTYDEALDAQIFIMNNFPNIACPIKNKKIHLSVSSSVDKEPGDYSELKTIPAKLDGFIGSLCSDLYDAEIDFKLKLKKNKNVVFKFNSHNDSLDAAKIIISKRDSGFKELDELWERYRVLYTFKSKNNKIILLPKVGV